MASYTNIFKRSEKKYLITYEQYLNLSHLIKPYMLSDKFGEATVNNIYFDTPDFRLIRASIEKPTVYKEKLRLRCYGEVTDDSLGFLELKKKYKGIVYKRRLSLPYTRAMSALSGEGRLPDTQIGREIESFISFYPGLRPALALFYHRQAFQGKEDSSLRITFDKNVRFRTADTDLRNGSEGLNILPHDRVLMEIKGLSAMPLWLSCALDREKIFPTSYSKYGNCYKLMLCDERGKFQSELSFLK